MNKETKKKSKEERIEKRVNDIISMQNIKTDPNGSYTGVPENKNEKPIQDADDL